jgi:hypothetical protein
MRIAPLSLLFVVACGGDGPKHWKDQPLEAQEGANDGVNFTIQLPKGMKKSSVESKYSVEWGYHAEVGGQNRVFAPSFSVSKASKKLTLEEAIKDNTIDIKAPTDVVWKEENATGWAYALENSSYKGKEDYIVHAQTAGDPAMKCHIRVYPMKKGGKAKDDIPLVAKMCWSIKTK